MDSRDREVESGPVLEFGQSAFRPPQAGTWRHFAGIIAFASVVRVIVLFSDLSLLNDDPDAYRALARGLAISQTLGIASEVITTTRNVDRSLLPSPQQSPSTATPAPPVSPTAYRPPLYPWMLSWLTSPQGHLPNASIALLHLVLGIATVMLTFWTAPRMVISVRNTLKRPTSQSTMADCPPNAPQTLFLRRYWWIAWTAAILVTIDPLLLQSSRLVMTETLAAFCVALGLAVWTVMISQVDNGSGHAWNDTARKRLLVVAIVLGSVFAAAYLCRPTFIVWPLLAGGMLTIWGMVTRNRAAIASVAAMLAVISVAVGLWSLRNQRTVGKPVWATTHGGYTLLLGNNPSFYAHLRGPGATAIPFWRNNWDATFFIDRWNQRSLGDPRTAAFWDPKIALALDSETQPTSSEFANGQHTDELFQDRLAYESALASIRRDPGGFLRACVWRWERLVGPMPLQNGQRPSLAIWAVTFFYVCLTIAVVWGVLVVGRAWLTPMWFISIALAGAFFSVHTFYWTDMRMRAPAVPVLSILAAATFVTRRFGSCQTATTLSTKTPPGS